jgi:hypothetical protein
MESERLVGDYETPAQTTGRDGRSRLRSRNAAGTEHEPTAG